MKITALIILLFLPIIVNAQTFNIDGIYYKIKIYAKDHSVEVTENPYSYKGYVTIPEKVEYLGLSRPVTSIGVGAFTNSEGLLGVSLPNTITIIDDNAFSGCIGLTEFIIPSSVEHLLTLYSATKIKYLFETTKCFDGFSLFFCCFE